LLLVAALAGSLVACGSDAPEDAVTGRLTLGITDAPVDSATRVVVQFSGVELQPAEGERIVINYAAPTQIDLLALHGGAREFLLDGQVLPAGRYNWILLKVDATMNQAQSFIEYDDGTIYPLFIPSGAEQGLRLVRGFDVPVNGEAEFTIDFDLRRSVIRPPGIAPNHILRPALRIVDNSETGGISGTVDNDLINPLISLDECTPAVYVYEGHDVTPSDVREGGGPLTTAFVRMNDQGVYRYRASFLTAGSYTVAFTCEADQDDPETADDIAFIGGTANTIVIAGSDATVNFPVDE